MKTAICMTVLCMSVLPSLVGCGQDQPTKAPENASAPAPGETSTATAQSAPDTTSASGTVSASANATADAGAAGASASGGSESAPPDAPAALTDAQIIQVTHVANVGEIEQAKLAQSKAKDARVKNLAAMMIKDHQAADTKGTALAKKASLNPTTSPISMSLEGDARSATDAMKSQAGADFDKAYVEAQVKEHQAVLDTIDQKLSPSATSSDLKAYLAEVRPKIAMHLQHAQDLQKKMAK